jgi:Transcriptional regulators containing a DNA-binding HTH domain and an aminotransferase domain (MocR family) and their eukaryotic orthologs
MLPLKTLLSFDKNSTVPIYLQIANAIIQQIQNGIIKTGTKLPGSRVMANLLSVHRKTIIKAFDELEMQGWIEIRPYKGTFISEQLPKVKAQAFIEKNGLLKKKSTAHFDYYPGRALTKATVFPQKLGFDDGAPDVRLAPITELAQSMSRALRNVPSKELLSYTDPKGLISLREKLAQQFNENRGLNIAAENVLITRGSQMGIYLCTQLLLRPGDEMIVGATNYYVANLTFRQSGAIMNTIPVDEHGICVDAIEPICKKKKIRAVYLTSHHHHPTTVTLSPERRIRLLALAEQYRFAIIEDDYDYDFHYSNNPLLPLASADKNGNVIYLGSFSKTTAPAFRMGYLIAPESVIETLSRFRRIIDRQGETVLEWAFTDLLQKGILQRYLKKALKQYRIRRDYCCELLQSELGDCIHFKKPDGGMAIWAKFDPVIDLRKLSKKAKQRGLYLSDGTVHNPIGQELNATRLGFASKQVDEIEASTRLLRQLIDQRG